MNLPRFGVKRPVSTLMLFLGIFLLGVVSYFHLPLDMMPEITLPSISVITTYPGASPEDVEERVSKVIENAVSTVPNIEKVSSLSQESLSVVRLKFTWGTNLGDAANDIRDKLDFVKKELPEGAEEPVVFKFDISEMPILMVTAQAGENYSRLYKLVDKKVAEPLKRVPGVGTVWIQGGLKREIKVWVDRDKLSAYKLTIEDVADALQRENVTLPAGNLKSGLSDYLIRIPGEFKKVEEINNIIVSVKNGKPVYLKSIARVEDAYKEQTRRIHVEGKKGLVVIVQKQSGANTVAVSQKVRAKLKEISKDLPPDVKIGVMRDTAQFIISSLRNLATTLFWGSILVSIIVILFLGNVRGSFIILITLPFSLIFSFIFLYLNNYTLNWISLSSLVIALGMVVDGAIVVLESIYRKRESGGEIKEAAEAGAGEVGMAVMASYFTTIAIFIPLIFSKGIVGIMFRQMAWVIIVVLVGSLLVALTLSPMLASRILPRVPSRRPWVKRMESRYERILNISLSFPGRTLAIIFFFLLASFALFPFIKKEFFPRVDQGWVQAFVRLPVGTRVEETEKVMEKIEKIAAREVPEKEKTCSRVQGNPRKDSTAPWAGKRVLISAC
ncbi:MAG: efflux RND transporter permease subunit [Caldiserica bacterium]|nr:efflux RND transporter permease subunit [Caldisericota bacterium]